MPKLDRTFTGFLPFDIAEVLGFDRIRGVEGGQAHAVWDVGIAGELRGWRPGQKACPVVMACVVALVSFSVWTTFFTDEGRVMNLVNEDLASLGVDGECVEAKSIRSLTPGVKLMNVRYSNGKASTVTWIRQGKVSKVEIESMP